tara:strand:- start:331 stop:1806 length:1476 start_codon:yes stop_codon:yes gene_type:complete
MKKALTSLIITAMAFGQEIIEFKTGTSFGECLGYCLSQLTITANDADYTLYGWDENDPVYLPVEISDSVDSIVWEDLNTEFNFELFMSLDSIIGCPDCVDGGAEWFEIVTIDTLKRVTIEYGDSLNGLDSYINLLRTIRQSFEEIQKCYYTPNPGVCLAAITKYYFDQEENECLEFTWGGCGGLVPFETLEDCELSCIADENELLSQTGFLRKTEASFCMDNCSVYFLENEYGEFLTWVTYLENIEMLGVFRNRYVNIEGDTVQCTECEAINVTSIEISDECQIPVSCFVDPCSVSSCYTHPEAECVANYCGGCWSDYYLDGELIQCGVPEGCIDLTGIDFGLCDMGLGIGWINNHCESISGCDWAIDSVDYSEAFFDSMDDCQESCIILNSPEFSMLPISHKIFNNYPNPFNPITTLRYDLTEDALVNITIYDMMGRVVKTMVNSQQNAGFKSVRWNATNDNGSPVSAGLYLYTIQAGDFRQTKKMVLLK